MSQAVTKGMLNAETLSGEEICVPSGRIRIPPPQRFGFGGVGAMCIVTPLLLPL